VQLRTLKEEYHLGEPVFLSVGVTNGGSDDAHVPASLHLHPYARRHNIFVLFVGHIPSGHSTDGLHDALTRAEQFAIFEQIAKVDHEDFGIDHRAVFPYAGGVPCSMRGTGIFVKITGQAFDCPGELIPLGDVRRDSLSAAWEHARPVTQTFGGGCAPREAFWAGHARPVQIQSLKPR
jgi:hypothetical protein